MTLIPSFQIHYTAHGTSPRQRFTMLSEHLQSWIPRSPIFTELPPFPQPHTQHKCELANNGLACWQWRVLSSWNKLVLSLSQDFHQVLVLTRHYKQLSKTWNPPPGLWKGLLYEVQHIDSLSEISCAKHSVTVLSNKVLLGDDIKHKQHLESQSQHSSSKFCINSPYLTDLWKVSSVISLEHSLAVLSTGACPSGHPEPFPLVAASYCHN